MSKSTKKRSSGSAPAPPKALLQIANNRANPLASLLDYDSTLDCLHRQVVGSSEASEAPNSLRIISKKWSEMDTVTQQWMMDLTEANMSELYKGSAWGWNRSSKMSELKHERARHLLVYLSEETPENEENGGLPIGYAHYRFEEGYANDASLYCYELQLVEAVRRRRIGATLMGLLQELATVHRMKKVLLTVLKENGEAMKFYTEGLQFIVDKNSPSKFGEVVDYEILSKNVQTGVAKKK